jgi:hypothetical protein
MKEQLEFRKWMAKIGNIYYCDDEQMERACERLDVNVKVLNN